MVARGLVLVAGFLVGAAAFAQEEIDPSSALLLSSPGSSRPSDRSQREQAVESGRYTVRPKSSMSPVPQAQRRIESTSRGSGSSSTVVNPVVVQPAANGAVLLRETRAGDTAVSVAASAAPSTESGSPSPMQAVGASANQERPQESSAERAGSVHASDEALLQLSVASAYYSESSASNYSFRNYGSSGPAYAAEARAWLSGEFGIGASYFSSLAGHVSDGAVEVAAGRTELVWGALIRQRFAEGSLIFAVEAIESQFAVAAEAQRRLKTKSSGYRFRLEGNFADWASSVSLAPKLGHEELPTATSFQSGAGVEAYTVAAYVERRWRFDSRNQLFVRLQHAVERNLFTGSATRLDPTSGQTPVGVGVTVGTTLIQFGYHWAN